ncbi:MAG: hypothetical protein FWD63_06240 [Propionibacteriaceae bacterium]|nr:hypothetical protein [Propionibacteriaceae bacterium]
MPRRPNKHTRPARPLVIEWAGTSNKSDGRWITRTIADGGSTKPYVCPGCNQTIQPGVAHLVVWPETPPLGSSSGVEHRRHWHTACWQRRR